MDFVKRGILLGFATKLGSGFGGVSIGRNLNQSSTLPIVTIGVVGTLQMVFTNSIMTTHMNMIIDRPSVNSMVVGGYKNLNAMNPRGGYQKPFVVTTQIFDQRNGHYVRPNRVALKYFDLKKYVDLDAHVKMFNFVVKANVETSEDYIINAFGYMLKNMASDECHNYMSKFLDCTFLELTHAFCKHHQKDLK
jgi:hypothetical protein